MTVVTLDCGIIHTMCGKFEGIQARKGFVRGMEVRGELVGEMNLRTYKGRIDNPVRASSTGEVPPHRKRHQNGNGEQS